MPEEAAHEEANMMRAQVRMEDKKEQLTAEDYEQALEAVLELKRLAEEEPTTVKVLYEAARVARYMGAGFGNLFADIYESLKSSVTGDKKPPMRFDSPFDPLSKTLDDAAEKLRVLKDQAEFQPRRDRINLEKDQAK